MHPLSAVSRLLFDSGCQSSCSRSWPHDTDHCNPLMGNGAILDALMPNGMTTIGTPNLARARFMHWGIELTVGMGCEPIGSVPGFALLSTVRGLWYAQRSHVL